MPDKRYNLTTENRTEYFYACLKAEMITLEIAVSYVNEFMREFRSSGHTRALFIRDTNWSVNREHFKMILGLIATMVPKRTRFAVVDASESIKVLRDTLAGEGNFGKLDIAAFETFDAAEKWLTASDH